MTAEQLELSKRTPETLEEELAVLGQALEDKLIDTVEPQGKLDEDGNFVEMTYGGTLVRRDESMNGYVWRTASVTIPDDNEKPRRYSVGSDIPHRSPTEWQAGDKTASFTNKDIRGMGDTVHELTSNELDALTKDVADSRVFDNTKEEVVYRERDFGGMMVGSVEEIVPIKKPSKLRHILGRKAAGDRKVIH